MTYIVLTLGISELEMTNLWSETSIKINVLVIKYDTIKDYKFVLEQATEAQSGIL